jgi:predicted kinase
VDTGTIIWINGSFGVGKTTIARELTGQWPRAVLFDPELVGSLLRAVVPQDLQTEDYQDMALWRDVTTATAAALVHRTRRPVVVPMTLVVPEYFEDVIGSLRRAGIEVRHFTLRASRDTIQQRLQERADTTDWTWAQIDRCLASLDDPRFARHIETDGRQIAEVANEIRHALSN